MRFKTRFPGRFFHDAPWFQRHVACSSTRNRRPPPNTAKLDRGRWPLCWPLCWVRHRRDQRPPTGVVVIVTSETEGGTPTDDFSGTGATEWCTAISDSGTIPRFRQPPQSVTAPLTATFTLKSCNSQQLSGPDLPRS